MAELAAAFAKFRRGLFIEARADARTLIESDKQNFWAHYLAAVSAAFEPDLKEFEKHLADLESFPGKNTYLTYLKAYYSLLSRDVEKALWHYLEIADDAEGWLAKALIKKFRKVKELKEIEFRVADFIVLPSELPPATKPAQAPQRKPSVAGWQYGKSERRSLFPQNFPYAKIFLAGLIVFTLAGIAILVRQHLAEKKGTKIPELQIADSAAVMPVKGAGDILYRYKTREGIITDFDRAKSLLQARKVNQCRFVLGRLIHSNADFQTREKSRIFLGFIPDPDYSDFNDNIALADVFSDSILRKDSLILISGEIRDVAEDSGGKLYQFMARENGKEYRVHAFLGAAQVEEKSGAAAKQVQVYGKFKGLIGEQKTVYLEALRVWR